MSDPKIAIAITADDKTAKGRKAAERSLGQIPKHVSAVNRRAWADDERRVGSHGRAMARTFGEVEKAGAKIFGGRSITSGVTTRMGAMREAAAGLGSGLGEASAAGGVLSSTIGAVGVAAAGTIGILAAATIGALNFATGWAKGAASISRTAETIGVGTKALQEFEAAAQRAGLEKGAGTGALGGLSQTLNDARYGRNSAALAMLGRLGVGIKTKADGTVDVEAMLPAIFDGIARQNSSGARTATQALGMSTDMVPFLRGGARKLAAEMKDADGSAAVMSDDDISLGKRVAREKVIADQWTDRKLAQGGAVTARGGQAVVDGAREFAGTVDRSFRPAAEKIERAAGMMVYAAYATSGGGGRLSARGAMDEARKGVRLRAKLLASGFNQADATALAANAVRESGADYRRREPRGGGVGLWQWTNKKRKDDFRRIMGVAVENSSEDQQIAFLKWELTHKDAEAGGWRRAQANGSDAASVAAGFAAHVERPANIPRDSAERAAVARALDQIPVKVEVELRGAPPGSRAKVTAGRRTPAVSHAYQP